MDTATASCKTSSSGVPYLQWVLDNITTILKQLEHQNAQSPVIIDPTAIQWKLLVITDTQVDKAGDGTNHGKNAGSNRVSGIPSKVIDPSEYGDILKLNKDGVYVLPLFFHPALITAIKQWCATFVTQKGHFNIVPNIESCANALACGLKSVVWHFCQAINEANDERAIFLLDMIYRLTTTINQLCDYSPECANLFDMAIGAENSGDMMINILALFVRQTEFPTIATRCAHFCRMLSRIINSAGRKSFIEFKPSGLIATLCIIPMIFSMKGEDPANILKAIIKTHNLFVIRTAKILSSVPEQAQALDTNQQNIKILECLVNSCETPYFPGRRIQEAYNHVITGVPLDEIPEKMGLRKVPAFVIKDAVLTINNVPRPYTDNKPVITQEGKNFSARGLNHGWSGVIPDFEVCSEFEICLSLNGTLSDGTVGKVGQTNFRFGCTGSDDDPKLKKQDITKGGPGFSPITNKVYIPERDKYETSRTPSNPTKPFNIKRGEGGRIMISQDGKSVIDPRLNMTGNPIISLTNGKVTIKPIGYKEPEPEEPEGPAVIVGKKERSPKSEPKADAPDGPDEPDNEQKHESASAASAEAIVPAEPIVPDDKILDWNTVFAQWMPIAKPPKQASAVQVSQKKKSIFDLLKEDH
jgi:hypothetical protein